MYRYAVSAHGEAYSWGRGRYGTLGHDDGEQNHAVPTRIRGLKSNLVVSRIASGRWHCVVLLNDNQILSWGRNHRGQLGLGFVSRANSKPAAIELEPGERLMPIVRDVAAGIRTANRTNT